MAWSYSRTWKTLTLTICASVAMAARSFDSPGQVSAAIDRKGASAFFRSLDEQATERLFHRIETGETDWVALVPKLAEGADGANAEGLGIALAYALPHNPEAVLKVVDPVEGDQSILSVERVCGMPFIEGAPEDYKAKALRAVSAVTGVNPRVKERCRDRLRQS